MSQRAWAYVWSVFLAGAVLSVLALPVLAQSTSQWLTFAILITLAIVSHLFKARGAGHEAWHANLVFLFAGVLLLHPFLFVLLVIANEQGLDLDDALTRVLEKYRRRDGDRWTRKG